jgi:phosphatidate cytidylyltransferase
MGSCAASPSRSRSGCCSSSVRRALTLGHGDRVRRTLRDRSDDKLGKHERSARPARGVGRRGAVLARVGRRRLRVDAAVRVVSFLALREFVTLTHTRRGDHRSLLLAFFVVLPVQYVIWRRATSICSRCSSRSTCSWPPGGQRARQRPAALSRAHREDPVGHHGLRLRHEPRAGLAAAGVAGLRRPRRVPGALSWWSWSQRADRAGVREPRLRRRPVARQISRSVLVARPGCSGIRRRPGGGLLFWITPFKPWPAGHASWASSPAAAARWASS